MTLLALGMVERPGGVAGQRLERRRRRLDLEVGTQEFADGQCEGKLPGFEAVFQSRRHIGFDRDLGAVERQRRIGLEGARDVALHEQALAVVERRQRVVASAEIIRFLGDAEQRAQKILEGTRHLDQEIRLVLVCKLVGRGACGHQARMDIDVGRLQPACESRIETGKAVAVIEVVEAEAMAQRRRDHCRNIRVGRGVIRSCANRLNNTDRERKAPAPFATFMPDDGAGGFKHGPAPMQTAPASVRNWLLVVAAMIFFMIVLGALTRLTESGLSMVEWRPVTGWLPPMSDAAWQAELQKYLSSPQGRLINRGFSVDEFRQIFWLEFIHRLWGRLIGLAFALPLAWFWLRGQLTPALKPRLLALLVLGGLQGALGWAMVASGLIDRPAVSHYRLAAHLLLAVALYAYTVWLILELGPQGVRRDDGKLRREATALIGFLLIVMTWGALMAGLRAGTSHNTFPTMSGYWIPPGLFDQSPWWINFFENGTTIQFVHRWLAKLLVLGVLALAWRARRPETAGRGGDGAAAAWPGNRNHPERRQYRAGDRPSGRRGPVAHHADRRAPSRAGFSRAPAVG